MMKCVSLLAIMLKLIGWFKQNKKMSFSKIVCGQRVAVALKMEFTSAVLLAHEPCSL
jgi:uncharacterized membrane protein (UPF0136 family)